MKIPEKAFDLPLYHRFVFVPKGTPFFKAPGVQISGSIKSVKRAYQIAVELIKKDFQDIDVMCAVFYGRVSDYSETHVSFYTTKKFKKRFKL